MYVYLTDISLLSRQNAFSKYSLRAPIAQLGERRTLDHKVAGSILTRGGVLCP